MASEEKLGEIYVEVRAKVDQLEKDFAKIRSEYTRSAQGIADKWKKSKLEFDTSLGKKKLSELQALHDKLRAKFEKKISLDVSSASLASTKSKLESVERAMGGVSSKSGKLKEVFSSLTGFSIGAFGIGAAIAGLGQLIGSLMRTISETTAWQDNINDLSKALDFNGTTIRDIDYVMRQNGGTIDDMSMAFNRLYSLMQDASSGNKTAEATFSKLGVAISNTDGTMRSGESVFMDTIDALHNMQNGTQRAMTAQELFGRGWKEIIPLIEKGRDGVRGAGKELDNFGVKLNPDVFDKHMETTARWNSHMQGMKQAISEKAIPGLDSMREALIKVDEWLAKVNKRMEGGLWDPFGVKKDKEAGNVETIFDKAAKRKKETDERGVSVPVPELADLAKAADEEERKKKAMEEEIRLMEEADRMAEEIHQADMARVWGVADKGKQARTEEFALDRQVSAEKMGMLKTYYDEMGWGAQGFYDFRVSLIDAEADKIRNTLGAAYAETYRAQAMAQLPGELENAPGFVGPRRDQAGGGKGKDFSSWSESMKDNIVSTEAIASSAMSAFQEGFEAMWGDWAIFSDEAISKTSNDFKRGMMTMANAFQQAILGMMAQLAALAAVMAIANIISPGSGAAIGKMFGWGGKKAKEGGEFLGTSHGVIPAFASGGNFTVPQSFTNDSMLMRVGAGESVSVTPPGKSGQDVAVLNDILRATKAQTMTMALMQKQINVKADVGGNLKGRDLQLAVEKSQRYDDRMR
jgi:hypothetical protein